jgi:hypothetical protein
VGGYFPLVERTLLYLERRSPKRLREFNREVNEMNKRLAKAQERDVENVTRDIASEHASRAVGILQTGYTGVNTPHAYGSD